MKADLIALAAAVGLLSGINIHFQTKEQVNNKQKCTSRKRERAREIHYVSSGASSSAQQEARLIKCASERARGKEKEARSSERLLPLLISW